MGREKLNSRMVTSVFSLCKFNPNQMASPLALIAKNAEKEYLVRRAIELLNGLLESGFKRNSDLILAIQLLVLAAIKNGCVEAKKKQSRKADSGSNNQVSGTTRMEGV